MSDFLISICSHKVMTVKVKQSMLIFCTFHLISRKHFRKYHEDIQDDITSMKLLKVDTMIKEGALNKFQRGWKS